LERGGLGGRRRLDGWGFERQKEGHESNKHEGHFRELVPWGEDSANTNPSKSMEKKILCSWGASVKVF